jgi:hypothetical protein
MGKRLSEKEQREILKELGVSLKEEQQLKNWWKRNKNKTYVKQHLTPKQYATGEMLLGNDN